MYFLLYSKIEFYKARLFEKVTYSEDEANIRVNMRNFTKRIQFLDTGVEVFGHPRSIDHIYGKF